MQYTANLNGCKNDNFQFKCLIFFRIFAQNIGRGHTLDPPLTSTHNMCLEQN